MSLTSYRAAPPRGKLLFGKAAGIVYSCRLWVDFVMRKRTDLCGPGGDLLSRVLRQSTIGAEAFDGRVRDGIGSYRLAEGHQAGEDQSTDRRRGRKTQAGEPTFVEAKLVLVFSILNGWNIRFLIPNTIKPNGRLVPVS